MTHRSQEPTWPWVVLAIACKVIAAVVLYVLIKDTR